MGRCQFECVWGMSFGEGRALVIEDVRVEFCSWAGRNWIRSSNDRGLNDKYLLTSIKLGDSSVLRNADLECISVRSAVCFCTFVVFCKSSIFSTSHHTVCFTSLNFINFPFSRGEGQESSVMYFIVYFQTLAVVGKLKYNLLFLVLKICPMWPKKFGFL